MKLSSELVHALYYDSVNQVITVSMIKYAINELLFKHVPLDSEIEKAYRLSIANKVVAELSEDAIKQLHQQMNERKGTPYADSIAVKQEVLIARAINIATQYDETDQENLLRSEIQNETAIQNRIQLQIDTPTSRSSSFDLKKAQKEVEKIGEKLPLLQERLDQYVTLKDLTKQIRKILLVQE